jgi:hypothetical protein
MGDEESRLDWPALVVCGARDFALRSRALSADANVRNVGLTRSTYDRQTAGFGAQPSLPRPSKNGKNCPLFKADALDQPVGTRRGNRNRGVAID